MDVTPVVDVKTAVDVKTVVAGLRPSHPYCLPHTTLLSPLLNDHLPVMTTCCGASSPTVLFSELFGTVTHDLGCRNRHTTSLFHSNIALDLVLAKRLISTIIHYSCSVI